MRASGNKSEAQQSNIETPWALLLSD